MMNIYIKIMMLHYGLGDWSIVENWFLLRIGSVQLILVENLVNCLSSFSFCR